MMRRCALVICLSALLAAALLASGNAAAQERVIWGEPVNLSNSPTGSVHPAVITGPDGLVHVFWSERMDGQEVAPDELPEEPDTIFYRRWDGQVWSEPLDILAVADDPLADFVAATIDRENQLHLVWTGSTQLYYSTAPATEAHSVRAWSAPQVIAHDIARTRFESDVAVDSQGDIHVVYASGGSAPGVYHIAAPLTSPVWSMPVRLSDHLRANEIGFRDVRLLIDASDRLHTVWSTSNPNGFGQAVYYVGSNERANAWDLPVRLLDATINTGFAGFPYLLARGSDQLTLIHVGEDNQGRIERTSIDAGKTWSEPRFILPGMEGVNGYVIPLLDGGGGLHLVINMRPSADQQVGIYYAPRAGLDWRPIDAVAVEAPYGPSAHNTDATVRLGNEIHVVWTQLRGGEIWHVRGEIPNAPKSEALAIPTQTPVATAFATVQATEPIATAIATELAGTAPPTASFLQPLLLGGLASALIVLSAVLWTRARSR